MATVRASCATCGDVEMTTRDVQVQICESNGVATYSFLCPACRLLVNKEATPQVVEILTGAGVPVTHWSLPAELGEAHWGAPVTHDDLLGFHERLQQAGWLEQAVAALDAGSHPTWS